MRAGYDTDHHGPHGCGNPACVNVAHLRHIPLRAHRRMVQPVPAACRHGHAGRWVRVKHSGGRTTGTVRRCEQCVAEHDRLRAREKMRRLAAEAHRLGVGSRWWKAKTNAERAAYLKRSFEHLSRAWTFNRKGAAK